MPGICFIIPSSGEAGGRDQTCWPRPDHCVSCALRRAVGRGGMLDNFPKDLKKISFEKMIQKHIISLLAYKIT